MCVCVRVLFRAGGRVESRYYSDLWRYSRRSNTWLQLSAGAAAAQDPAAAPAHGALGTPSASVHPGGRAFACGVADPATGVLYLHGGEVGLAGSPAAMQRRGDIFAFHPDSGQWEWRGGSNYVDEQYTTSRTSPGGRSHHACWFHPDQGLLLVHSGRAVGVGGPSPDDPIDDFWSVPRKRRQAQRDGTGRDG